MFRDSRETLTRQRAIVVSEYITASTLNAKLRAINAVSCVTDQSQPIFDTGLDKETNRILKLKATGTEDWSRTHSASKIA